MIDGVEVDLVVVKAAMDVVWVTLGWSILEEFESEVQFGKQVHICNISPNK